MYKGIGTYQISDFISVVLAIFQIFSEWQLAPLVDMTLRSGNGHKCQHNLNFKFWLKRWLEKKCKNRSLLGYTQTDC